MPDRYYILSKAEVDRLMEKRRRIVISEKEMIFLNTLGLGEFLGDLETQHDLYKQAKVDGLKRVRTDEMKHFNWAVENALVIALRRSLWGGRDD